MNLLKIKVESIKFFWQSVQTRMPFRYGSAKLERCPHLYVVAQIRDEKGAVARGIASDNLPPKWFDKAPEKDYAQELRDQIQVIRWAAEAAQNCEFATPFRLWWQVSHEVHQKAAQAYLPKLLAGFGPSLLERAVNDAAAKLCGLSFFQYLKSNAAGVELEAFDASFKNLNVRDILPTAPRKKIFARHTVGLSDPIRNSEIHGDEKLGDGLPQSLDDVIRFYGVRYFKIKVCNQLEHDIARLENIAAVLDETMPNANYVCTLDGNEQYESFEQVVPLVEQISQRLSLRRMAFSLLFVEQPLARAYALDAARCGELARVAKQFPVIIDEADDALDSFGHALALGYSGTSHKNCKNTFKSVANLARVQQEKAAGRRAILSAEDLTNIGIVALQQDLVALSTLGISHAERNGHHYFRGLSHLSRDKQNEAVAALPQLYTEENNLARLQITNGEIDVAALHQMPGLGTPVWPDLDACRALDQFDAATF